MPDLAHFILSSSFIKLQRVELEHVSSLTFAGVFRALARVIRVLRVKSCRVFEFQVPRSSTSINWSKLGLKSIPSFFKLD